MTKLASQKYNASEKGKATHAAYRAANRQKRLEQGAAYRAVNREALAEQNAIYRAANMDKEVQRVKLYRLAHPEKTAEWARAEHKANPEPRRAAVRKWEKEHPDEAAAMARKHRFTRRTLGFIPINESFTGCDGHHLDTERVMYIPHILHMGVPHNVWTGKGMAQMNAVAYNYLFKQEVEAVMVAKEVKS